MDNIPRIVPGRERKPSDKVENNTEAELEKGENTTSSYILPLPSPHFNKLKLCVRAEILDSHCKFLVNSVELSEVLFASLVFCRSLIEVLADHMPGSWILGRPLREQLLPLSLLLETRLDFKDLIPVMKFWLMYPAYIFMSRGLESYNDPPKVPKFGAIKPVFYPFSGKIKRYIKSRSHSSNQTSARLVWGLFQGVKRSGAEVPSSFFVQEQLSHLHILTTGVDRLPKSIEHMLLQAVMLTDQISSYGPLGTTITEEISSAASFQTARMQGGGRNELMALKDDTGLTPDQLKWSTNREIFMNEERPGEIKTSYRFLPPRLSDLLRWSKGQQKNSHVMVHPLAEPLKVRIITKAEASVTQVGRLIQRPIHDSLRSQPVFELLGNLVDETMISELGRSSIHFWKDRFGLKPDSWLSGDYKAATDSLNIGVTRALLASAFIALITNKRYIKKHEPAVYRSSYTLPRRVSEGAEPPNSALERLSGDFYYKEEFHKNVAQQELSYWDFNFLLLDYTPLELCTTQRGRLKLSDTEDQLLELFFQNVDGLKIHYPKRLFWDEIPDYLENLPNRTTFLLDLIKRQGSEEITYYNLLYNKQPSDNIDLLTSIDFYTLLGEFVSRRSPFLMKNGQLMGSIISFPLLCLANFTAFAHATHVYLQESCGIENQSSYDIQKYLLIDGALRINGDDILAYIPKEFYPYWKKTISLYGFTLSPGKNYLNKTYLTVNSQMFTYHCGKVTRLNFFNVGLLIPPTGDRQKEKSLSSRFNELIRGVDQKIRTVRRFVHYNKEIVQRHTQNGLFNLFFPLEYGGLGLDLTWASQDELKEVLSYTHTQLNFASQMRKRYKKLSLRPLRLEKDLQVNKFLPSNTIRQVIKVTSAISQGTLPHSTVLTAVPKFQFPQIHRLLPSQSALLNSTETTVSENPGLYLDPVPRKMFFRLSKLKPDCRVDQVLTCNYQLRSYRGENPVHTVHLHNTK